VSGLFHGDADAAGRAGADRAPPGLGPGRNCRTAVASLYVADGKAVTDLSRTGCKVTGWKNRLFHAGIHKHGTE
jgi:hypothetical protein